MVGAIFTNILKGGKMIPDNLKEMCDFRIILNSANTMTPVLIILLILSMLALPASAAIQATSIELRGTVANQTAIEGGFNASNVSELVWMPQTFAGFFYDPNDNLGKEKLQITAISIASRTIPKDGLVYSTSAQPKQLKVVKEAYAGNGIAAAAAGLERVATSALSANGEYYIIGWQAEQYVALNGKVEKLSKLITEHGTSASEKKTLTVGETWEVGDGWTLTANSIDAKATPRQVWLTLSKEGVKKDDKVISAGTGGKPIFTYVEKSICGETDVPLFVTYVDSVFAGATTDMVQLRYTWVISSTCTEIKSGDTYGKFKDASFTGKNITIDTDASITLSKDSTIDLMGNMKFRTADSDTLRFYPMVEYQIVGPGGETGAVPLGGTPVKTTPKANVTTNVTTAPPTAPPTAPVTTTAAVVATTKKEPGFEAFFAIVGLLAVAFLVLRQRK